MKLPLIAPKSYRDFSPEEYHQHVTEMFEMRKKGGKPVKHQGPAEGLSVSRTRKGAVSVKRIKKVRPFAYVTHYEVEALAREAGFPIVEVWNAFKAKKFIIAESRMEAERIYADINELPW